MMIYCGNTDSWYSNKSAWFGNTNIQTEGQLEVRESIYTRVHAVLTEKSLPVNCLFNYNFKHFIVGISQFNQISFSPLFYSAFLFVDGPTTDTSTTHRSPISESNATKKKEASN